MLKVVFHPAAATEYEEALYWYAERSERAANRFDDAVSLAIREIEQAPERWARLDDRHRVKILVKNYPYHIVYGFDGEILTVIAVAHHRRRPNYWESRQ